VHVNLGLGERLKLVFELHFRYGALEYYEKDQWKNINAQEIFEAIRKVGEMKSYSCKFNPKDRNFKVTIKISPLGLSSFVPDLRQEIKERFKKEVDIHVLEMTLEKREVPKFETAILMSKIRPGEGSVKSS